MKHKDMKEKFKIVKVIWKDAQTINRVLSLDEVKQTDLAFAHTIGYLIDENKERIVVCGFYFSALNDQDIDGFRDSHFIPKKWIKEITELREVKKR